jgi:hypothetical protein
MDMASPADLPANTSPLDGLGVMVAAYDAWGDIADNVPNGPADHPAKARDSLVRGIAMSKAASLTALASKLRVWTAERKSAWDGHEALPAGDLLVASCLVDAARLLGDEQLLAALPAPLRAYFADFDRLGDF